MLDRGQLAAIMLTDIAASTMPIACHRVSRSRSTMIAKTTVVAGYSEIRMLASDSIHFWIASSMLTLAQVSSSAARTARRNGVVDGSSRFLLAAATAITRTVAAARAKNSGHIRHTTGAWCSRTKSSPKATPDPIVNQATLLVNLWVRTSTSSGDSRLTMVTASIANTTPTDALAPGRSPSATPTATGTAALRTAASGDTNEMGPALTAA